MKSNLSSVGGVVSPDGGLRFIVSKFSDMKNHVEKEEKLFVIPNYKIQEPVPWEEIHSKVILPVTKYVFSKLVPNSPCGECKECCITLYIHGPDEFWPNKPKPSHTMCGECNNELGCMKYLNRPKVCRSFECLWLKSQKPGSNRKMSLELRPDKCGVIFTEAEFGDKDNLIYLHPNIKNPKAYLENPVKDYLEEIQKEGFKVKLVTSYFKEKGK